MSQMTQFQGVIDIDAVVVVGTAALPEQSLWWAAVLRGVLTPGAE